MTDKQKERLKQIRKVREKLSDKEVFLSKAYHDSLWKYARVLGSKRDVILNISYEEGTDGGTARTDGTNIFLNAANSITGHFTCREDKVASHEGIVAHECGHIRFSDFERRTVYLNGFPQGLMYPWPPEVKTAADRRAWKEMKEYLKTRDLPALLFIQNIAKYLSNVLEDVYVEAGMCAEYPGSVCTAIQKNAACLIADIPSEDERQNAKDGGLSIMIDLVFRYARAGKTEAEEGYSRRYLRSLEKCRSVIDNATVNSDPDSRLIATNWLMIRLWGYIQTEIKKVKTEVEGLSDDEIREKMKEIQKRDCQWPSLSMDSMGSMDGKEIEGWNGDPDRKLKAKDTSMKEESNGDKTNEERKKESGDENGKTGKKEKLSVFRADVQKLGKGRDTNGQISEMDGDTGSGDGGSLAKKLPEIQNAAAEDQVNRSEEQKLLKKLQEMQKNLELDEIHKDIDIQIHRKLDVSEELEKEYACVEPKVRKTSLHLQKVIEDILKRQEGGRLSGLYMGKRLSKGSLYRRDGKLFEKRIAPDDGFSIAVAVLVDVSGSMDTDNRIDYARMTSLVFYDFCQKLSIPVMVYGHTTHYTNNSLGEEVVDVFAFADFDSVDGQDYLRIMDMRPIGGNRDGAALQLVGNRLCMREEEIKLLILISDGNPRANNYFGETAKLDLQNVKRNLERKGVKMFAAAIGDDRQKIEEIYQDGFLNISDLKAMPLKLAGLLTNYLR